MKTLLAILAHPRDNELLSRHWSYFVMTGWDIIGLGPNSGQPVAWPEPVPVRWKGELGTRQTPAGPVIFGLIEQELDIIAWFLGTPCYDALMIAEADNLFVRKPPDHPRNGMYLAPILPNYAAKGLFKTPVYFSTPRFLDRKCAEQFLAHARGMVQRGDVEWWVSDRFPAAVCHQGKIPWMNFPAWSPLPFTWDAPDAKAAWVRDARCAIAMGACCLHSVKAEWQLDAVKDLLPCL